MYVSQNYMTNISKIRKILFFLVTTASIACNLANKKTEPVWSELPEVTILENLKQTDFSITLENQISDNKNIIYSPTFLFAWDKIEEELKSPIIPGDQNSLDFKLLNKSISHQNSLIDTEYTASAQVIDGAIFAEAFFNKTLPFETKLQVFESPIKFDSIKVLAFGMYYYDEQTIKITEILYYRDDNNFILKLSPKDKQHEIILAKGISKYKTLKDAIALTTDLIEKGKQERINNNLIWKYKIVNDDLFAIPNVKFNIKTNYKSLEGQNFFTKDNKEHIIQEAYQRTGFILNENGAVVESHAIVKVDSASDAPIVTHPKKMIFDKPFLIIVKRVDKRNPYFVMKVANAELLTRE